MKTLVKIQHQRKKIKYSFHTHHNATRSHNNMNPRPVPSECIDMTPSSMWDAMWDVNPSGELEMPQEVKTDCGPIRFWKNHWFKFQKDLKFSRAVHKKLRLWHCKHREDPTERIQQNAWDDRRHGYWQVNGKLQYRSVDGVVHLNVDGAGDRIVSEHEIRS